MNNSELSLNGASSCDGIMAVKLFICMANFAVTV